MKTNFYEIGQNNSGGSFVVNDKLCHKLIIEAANEQEALGKAEELGCYWNGCADGSDYPCCGDRWSRYTTRIDTKKKIEDYVQHIANEYGWTKPDARIFYKAGKVKEIFSSRVG